MDKCGCTAILSEFGHETEIVFCPLHKAAPELLDACQAALITLNINRKQVVCQPLEDKLRAAITKAEERHD